MSVLTMQVKGALYFAEPNPDMSGIRFYKYDGKMYHFIATIIDNGDSFTYCRLIGNKIYTKKLNPQDEILWTDRNGEPIKEDDTKEQVSVTTGHGRKLLVQFPDLTPFQRAFLIGFHNGKVFKLIADARVVCGTLKFTFDL
ncbi:MAG: hypothetical protein IKL09_02390 [Clostridia bacterium]|nr:hypothetical protein [Clostridia bacterium]